jgi:hypothetical protein
MSICIRLWPWAEKNQNPYVAKIANLGILSTAMLNKLLLSIRSQVLDESWIIDPQNSSVVLKFNPIFLLIP